VGNVLRAQAFVDRLPAFAAIIGSECSRGGNGDPYPLWIAWIENNGVQAHAARTRLPLRTSAVPSQPREFLPVLAAIGRAEQRRILDSGVGRIRIGERWLDMPHPLELPGTLGTVVILVGCERLARFRRRVINKFIALALRPALRSGGRFASRRAGLVPALATVVGALNDLAEPPAGLRHIDSIRVGVRTLHVINLPAGKVRTA